MHFLHTKNLYLYLLRKSTAFFCALLLSHPARGAWIEIGNKDDLIDLLFIWSHPARGAWIEMYSYSENSFAAFGRTPQGVRGLK